jgi:hypothetical protein
MERPRPVTTTEILSELARRGVHLEVIGDKLRWRPKDAVPDELVEALRGLKGEIIAVLSPEKRCGFGMCPGPSYCGGCYPVAAGCWMHPPKVSEAWRSWFDQNQPDGRGRLQ